MAEETQSWPLAPARAHQRSDEENPAFKSLQRERNNKCFVYVFAAIVLQSVVVLVFALIALRAKAPGVKLRAVHVKSLRYSTSPVPSFNATLVAELSIENPNFGPYEYEGNNSASFLYGGAKLGERRVAKGRAAMKGTMRVNVTTEVRSNRLPEGTNHLSQDLNSGALNLTSYSRFSGRVHLIRVFKNRKTSVMNCTMTLVLKSKRIKDLRCH